MQLDIFEHSRDTVLRNDVTDALARRDAVAAQAAWQALADEFPQDETLAPLARLVDALGRHRADDAPFAGHEEARAARCALIDELEPAAQRIFGPGEGTAWLRPLWGTLARRAARLPFAAECSDDHAAALWLRAHAWSSASEAVARIASWRRIPAPLAWMAEARYRAQDLDGAWDLLAELAWLSPPRFDTLTQRLADPLLVRLRKAFDADFEGSGDVRDLAWFPAWVLTEKPGLSQLLSRAQPGLCTGPEQAMRLMVELLGLERQGRQHDVIARRRTLRDAYPPLHAAYMRSR